MSFWSGIGILDIGMLIGLMLFDGDSAIKYYWEDFYSFLQEEKGVEIK